MKTTEILFILLIPVHLYLFLYIKKIYVRKNVF